MHTFNGFPDGRKMPLTLRVEMEIISGACYSNHHNDYFSYLLWTNYYYVNIPLTLTIIFQLVRTIISLASFLPVG